MMPEKTDDLNYHILPPPPENYNVIFSKIKRRFDGSFLKKIRNYRHILSFTRTNDEHQVLLAKYIENEIKFLKLTFFLGGKIAAILHSSKKFYDFLHAKYLFTSKDSFIFKEIRVPIPENKYDKHTFIQELRDVIFPYIYNTNTAITIMNYSDGEGLYEMDENVCLKKNDIVIDCGANMGFFSAIASSKGCIIYAFEPFPYVIEKYLSKTAEWNKNINICQYALWDQETELEFEQNHEIIGSSTVTDIMREGHVNKNFNIITDNKIKVKAIKLDDFVYRNNLPKVDFIKADIEGSERNMLLGAKNIIREFSPKISICTYHLPDDSKVLREILLDIQPKYIISEQFKKMYAYVPNRL